MSRVGADVEISLGKSAGTAKSASRKIRGDAGKSAF
jgi:hypothetical protein